MEPERSRGTLLPRDDTSPRSGDLRSLKADTSREDHWTYALFVEHPELFLPSLELRKERTPAEIEGLSRIFREFGLSKRSKILDLMCGIGRHSIRLAKKGYEVVGFDLSSFYLNKARRWARREKLGPRKVRFYQGDARDAAKLLTEKNEKGFDAIINMYTSIGYYGEEEDLRLFKEIRGLSSPKCLLIIDTANRDFFIRHFEQFSFWNMTPTIEWHENRKLDLETSCLENTWKFYQKTEKGGLKLLLKVPVTHRIYSLHELKKILSEAGWKLLRSYGSIESLGPLTFDSSMTLVSQVAEPTSMQLWSRLASASASPRLTMNM